MQDGPQKGAQAFRFAETSHLKGDGKMDETNEEMHAGNILDTVWDEAQQAWEPIKEGFSKAKEAVGSSLSRTKWFLFAVLMFNLLGLTITTLGSRMCYDPSTFQEAPSITTWRFFTALISFMSMLGYYLVFARIAVASIVAVTGLKIIGWVLEHLAHAVSHVAPPVASILTRIKVITEEQGRMVTRTTRTEGVSVSDAISFDELDLFLRRISGALTWVMVIDFLLQFPLYRSLTDLMWVMVAAGILIGGIYAWKREEYWLPILQDGTVLLVGGSIVVRILFGAFLPGYWQKLVDLFPGWGPDTTTTRVYWYLGFALVVFLIGLAFPPRSVLLNSGERTAVGGLKAGFLAIAVFVLAGLLLFGAPITRAIAKTKSNPVGSLGQVGIPAVESGRYDVSARTPWPVSVSVKRGQVIDLSAEGVVVWKNVANSYPKPFEECGVEGTPPINRADYYSNINMYLCPNAFKGALIGRLGMGDPFPIGSSKQIKVEGDSTLYLGINDMDPGKGGANQWADNSKSYKVVLSVH